MYKTIVAEILIIPPVRSEATAVHGVALLVYVAALKQN
mgnify:CR=1 FL=1